MIKPQQFTAKLEEKIELSAEFTHYTFELAEPHRLQFEAGQYVSLKVSDKGERRSYSIIHDPSIQHGFELLVDHTPQGVGTQFLQSLSFGDEVTGLGPLGQFTVADMDAEQGSIFVATGSGIAPLKSMIVDLLINKQDTRPVKLYWGMRHATDLFWLDDFADLEKYHKHFSFIPTLSQAPAEWTLSRGRVTDILRVVDILPDVGYYLCGSTEMVHEVSDLLEKRGVSLQYIHHEKFY